MATRQGVIKKTPIEQFERVRSTGIRAITVAEGDDLAWVGVSSGDDDIVLATALGKIARFNESEVRPMGRDAAGVIGIRLARKGDQVVGMGVVQPDADILVLTETGYGKRVAADRVPREAPRRPGRPAHRARGRQDRHASPRSSWSPRTTRSCCSSAPAARSCGPTSRASTATAVAARGVIVMRLNEGDEVAGIAVFRAGLAEQRWIGDNDGHCRRPGRPADHVTAEAAVGATS